MPLPVKNLFCCDRCWERVEFKPNVLALPDSKNGSRPIYLSPTAVKLLKSQKASTREEKSCHILLRRWEGKALHNLRKPWGKVCAGAKIAGVKLHDLPHTAASIAAGQGVTEKLIPPSIHVPF